MERYKAIRIHACIMILSFGLIALIVGCAIPPISPLEDDRFSEPRFRSLIFGQLQIKGLEPIFAKFIFGVENKIWTTGAEIYRGDPLIPFFFVFETEPGEYLFKSIWVFSDLRWYFHHLDTTLSISIPSGSLVYLGLVELKVVEFDYEINIKNDIKNEFEKSLKALREKYPLLYEKYKDKVVTASCSKMKAAGVNAKGW